SRTKRAREVSAQHDVERVHHGPVRVAGSQCSSAFPSLNRHISNQVVVASFNSRTYATTTRSPSATTATTFVFIFAGIGTGFTLRTSVKYFTTPSRPDAALGLCWM